MKNIEVIAAKHLGTYTHYLEDERTIISRYFSAVHLLSAVSYIDLHLLLTTTDNFRKNPLVLLIFSYRIG